MRRLTSRSNKDLAIAYFEDALYSYKEALDAFKNNLYHRVIRRCQESVELSLKALLRYIGVEYPKSHDVSPLLYKFKDKIPENMREYLDFISKLSMELAMDRGPSFYGDENRRLPPKKLYSREYAEAKLNETKKLLDLIKEALT